MENMKSLEMVWSHVLSTDVPASVIKALVEVSGKGFDWSLRMYGKSVNKPDTYLSELIICISKNLKELGSSEWVSVREEWLNVWNVISRNKGEWSEEVWRSCVNAIMHESFNSNESDVQNQIVQEIPDSVWKSYSEEELRNFLQVALVKGDLDLVNKTIQLGVDLSKGHILRSQEYYDDGRQAYIMTPSICVTKDVKCIKALLAAGASTSDLQIVRKVGKDKYSYELIQTVWDFFMGEQNKDNVEMLSGERIDATLLLIKDCLKNFKSHSESLKYKNALIIRLFEEALVNKNNKMLLLKLIKEEPEFEECFALKNKIKCDLNIFNFLAVVEPEMCSWLLRSARLSIGTISDFEDEYGFKMEHYAMMGRSRTTEAFNHLGKERNKIGQALTQDIFLLKMLKRTVALSKMGVFDTQEVMRSGSQPLTVMHKLIEEIGNTEIGLKINTAMKKVCEQFSCEDQFEVIKMLERLSCKKTNATSLINMRNTNWLNDQIIFKNLVKGGTTTKDEDALGLRLCLAIMETFRTAHRLNENKEDIFKTVDEVLENRPRVWRALLELESGEYAEVWNRDVFSPLKEVDDGVFWNRMKSVGEAAMLKEINGVSAKAKAGVAL